MPLATLDPLNLLRQRWCALNCSDNSFLKLSEVGRTRIVAALTGKPGTGLNSQDLDRLTELVTEMEELARVIPVPIDWGQSERVDDVLFARRLQKASHDVSGDSKLFDELVALSTDEL